MLVPLNEADDAIVLEFKVHEAEEENSLQETVQSALKQIEEKKLRCGAYRSRHR